MYSAIYLGKKYTGDATIRILGEKPKQSSKINDSNKLDDSKTLDKIINKLYDFYTMFLIHSKNIKSINYNKSHTIEGTQIEEIYKFLLNTFKNKGAAITIKAYSIILRQDIHNLLKNKIIYTYKISTIINILNRIHVFQKKIYEYNITIHPSNIFELFIQRVVELHNFLTRISASLPSPSP